MPETNLVQDLLRVPLAIAALFVAWLLGEVVGGLAVRHVAWGAGIRGSLVGAVRGLLRPSAIVTLIATSLVLALVVAGSLGAVGVAWDHLRVVLAGGRATEVRVALVVFSLAWVAALWLIALALTWRATAWTFEVGRRRAP